MADEKVTLINPDGLSKPTGFSHAAAASGSVVALAGQVGMDADGHFVSEDLVEQIAQALRNLSAALEAAGGGTENLIKMTIFVRDVMGYKKRLKEIGQVYQEVFGKHYPPMTLVEVCRLFDPPAHVEIEGWAVV